MIKTYTLTCLLLLISWLTVAQPVPTPPIPAQVDFAGISVNFDDGARNIIQQDVRALLSNRQFWNAKLDRVVLYFPAIEAILTDEEVPTDFKYLAVQESSLLPDAISSSQAVGFWQFKRETALDHGMRVDDEVDERRSISASTHGAAKYLKRSNGIYHNWVSALYSYYLGTGGISKLISPDWSYAKEVYLDAQTDRYMLRFFAHKIAIESALANHQTANTIALVEYPKGNGKSISQIASEVGTDPSELRKYNRWLLTDNVPSDKAYSLMVPTPNNQINDVRQRIGQATDRPTADFTQNDVGFPVLRKITTGVRNANDPILYEINGLPGIQAQAGDNAGSLARKSRVSLSSFLRYNELGELDPVLPGEVYYLAKKRKKALVPYHNVREDETIRSIAHRYGIRTKFIMRYNRLDRVQKLQVGRVMWLREKRPKNRPVEVINSPTPPVYDRTPSLPSNQPASSRPVATQETNPTRSDDYPKTAGERKLYTPKLAGTPVDEPATKPAPTTAPPISERATTTPAPTRTNTPVTAAPATKTPDNPAGTQRVVIVRQGNGTTTTSTGTPTKSAPTIDENTIPTDDKPPINVPTKPSGNGGFEVTGNPSTATPTRTVPRSKPFNTGSVSTPKPETTPTTSPTKPAATPATTTASRGARSMTHTVQAGQTYYSISKNYGVTIDDLLAWNNLTPEDRLSVGQQLSIKNVPAGFPVGQEIKPSTVIRPKEEVFHTVQKGETMFRISKLYNVSIEQIQQWNELSDVAVKEGQKIKIIK